MMITAIRLVNAASMRRLLLILRNRSSATFRGFLRWRATALVPPIDTFLAQARSGPLLATTFIVCHGIVFLFLRLLFDRVVLISLHSHVRARRQTFVDLGRRRVHNLRRSRAIPHVSLVALVVWYGRCIDKAYFGGLSGDSLVGAAAAQLGWVLMFACLVCTPDFWCWRIKAVVFL